MNNVWTEEGIQKGLERLDAKTGMNGSGLPISFSNPKCTFGQYSSADGGSFRFSNITIRIPHGLLKRHLTPFGMNMRTTWIT